MRCRVREDDSFDPTSGELSSKKVFQMLLCGCDWYVDEEQGPGSVCGGEFWFVGSKIDIMHNRFWERW